MGSGTRKLKRATEPRGEMWLLMSKGPAESRQPLAFGNSEAELRETIRRQVERGTLTAAQVEGAEIGSIPGAVVDKLCAKMHELFPELAGSMMTDTATGERFYPVAAVADAVGADPETIMEEVAPAMVLPRSKGDA